jgi:RHS repeat-associated protein
VNSSGVLQASYKYNPYGGLISSSGTLATANTMRFSSKPAIFSSSGAWGFYYYGYRFYDPVNQRWLNRDPLEEAGGRNLYGFVGNRPTLAVDDYGNSPTLITGAIGVGLGAVIGGGIAWWNGGDAMAILEGAGRGALIGGIAGLTGGAAAGLIGGSGIGAGIAAGALGGAVGDLAGQGVELALGWRCEYSWKQTALSVGVCGAAGGAVRYLGRAGAAANTRAPKIRGHTPSLRTPAKVDQIKADMLAGKYGYEAPEGIFSGVVDKNGVIHITEGQHRMNAALEIFEESGNATHVEQLLDSARRGLDGRTYLVPGEAPVGSLPLPRR